MFASFSPSAYASSIRGSSLRSFDRVDVLTLQKVATSPHVHRRAAARLTSLNFMVNRSLGIVYPNIKIESLNLPFPNNIMIVLALLDSLKIYGFSNLPHYTYFESVCQALFLFFSIIRTIFIKKSQLKGVLADKKFDTGDFL